MNCTKDSIVFEPQVTRRKTTHGASTRGSVFPEYKIYHAARNRCENPNTKSYPRYGGRGIEFHFESFEEFWACLGKRPTPSHTLERKNNEGHYSPDNCSWELYPVQVRNRRSNQWVTVDGKTLCIVDWATERNIPSARLYARKRLGWCDECIITLPKKAQCPHN